MTHVALAVEKMKVFIMGDCRRRISIVDARCQTVLDVYSRPPEQIADYLYDNSSCTKEDIDNALPYELVKEQICNAIQGRIIVGHHIANDLALLNIRRRDCNGYCDVADDINVKTESDRKSRIPGNYNLKELAKNVIGKSIQIGHYSSLQNARTTMEIYNRIVV